MFRNIQEYLNNLVNKPTTFYLDLNNNPLKQKKPNCPDCNQPLTGKITCDNCLNNKQLEGEIKDLKEFTNLRGINVANNQLTNLAFLDTLPNKDKLKSLNLFGNQIKEVDFAELFAKFSNLEKINLQNNPLSAKNLENLTSEQFEKLVNGIKDKKIRVNSFKGTVLMDLLEYTQQLIKKGENTEHAHKLQAILQNNPVKNEKQPNKINYTPLIIGGVLIVVSALVIGYLVGKRKNNKVFKD